MKPICFYHSADLDGVCSGAVVHKFEPDAELCGYDYGQKFPWALACPELYHGCLVDSPPVFLDGLVRLKAKRRVYMIDVSLPAADMMKLHQVCDLIWIDHHRTAIEACAGIHPDIVGVRSTKMSACELTWLWFTEDRNVFQSRMGAETSFLLGPEDTRAALLARIPLAVKLLGRYDIWDHQNPDWDDILAFQWGCRSIASIYDPLSAFWTHVMDRWNADSVSNADAMVADAIDTGRTILRYQASQDHRACAAGAHEFVLTLPDPEMRPRVVGTKDGLVAVSIPSGYRFDLKTGERIPNDVMPSFRVLACNTVVFNSQFFSSQYDPKKHDVMCAYAQMSDGRWKVSMYSTKPNIDCGLICKAFGGGGHRSAAGFVCDKLPW